MKKTVLHHIEKIRLADEHKKRWWIAIATTIVMFIIIVLWVIYISATLPQATAPTVEIGSETQEIITEKPSIIGSVISGIKLTFANLSSSFKNIKNNFTKGIEEALQLTTKKNEVVIKKTEAEKPFQPNEAEQLEQVPLP